MIVTIAGSVGSGKSKVIGANALVHGSLGKSVTIITDEHEGKEYFRVNEHLKLDTSNMDVSVIKHQTIIYGRGDADLLFDAILDKLRGKTLDVLMLDLHVIDVTLIANKLQHHLSTQHDKSITVYVSVQTSRALSIK